MINHKLIPWVIVLLVTCLPGCGYFSEPIPATNSLATHEPAPPLLESSQPTVIENPQWKAGSYDSWQWQLTGEIDLSVKADIYDLDLFETSEKTIEEIHRNGGQAICYISVGSVEDWRPDAAAFSKEVIGRQYPGWPGERFLDIRRLDVLAPVLSARIRLCHQKGFDAVEPDNVDTYDTKTGFPLNYEDQLRFNQWVSDQAHQNDLLVGLKNDPEQVADLEPYFDFILTESCYHEGWCEKALPFRQNGKPVFMAEYVEEHDPMEAVCGAARDLGFLAIRKKQALDAYREVCP